MQNKTQQKLSLSKSDNDSLFIYYMLSKSVVLIFVWNNKKGV